MMWKDWNPHTLLVGMRGRAAALENSVAVPQKVTQLFYNGPAISLLGVYPTEARTSVRTNTCAALFITAKT